MSYMNKVMIFLSWSIDAINKGRYDSIATVGESRVWWKADFQSGSRVLKNTIGDGGSTAL